MLKSVKAAGTPEITDGKTVASQYVETLSGSANAYQTGATTFAKRATTSTDGINAPAQPTTLTQLTGQIAKCPK